MQGGGAQIEKSTTPAIKKLTYENLQKMKTNKIVLSLLCGSIAAVFATSCGEEKNLIPGDKYIDTIKIKDTVTTSIEAVNTLQFCADRAEHVIKFEAAGDWAWTVNAKDEWIKATKVSGTKDNGVIEFSLSENFYPKERRTVTTLKINGVDRKLTIVQKGTAPYVAIFNGKITLSKEMKEAYIIDIVSNVELEVASFPSWIKSVELETLEDYPGAHQAFVTLQDWNFDSDVRNDKIKFAGVDDPGVFKEFDISCSEDKEAFLFNTVGLTGGTSLPGMNADPTVPITATFTVYANPHPSVPEVPETPEPAPTEGTPELTGFGVVILEVYSEGRYTYQGATPWATSELLATRAAFSSTNVKITCANLTQPYAYTNREGAVYVMPAADVDAFIARAEAAGNTGISDAPRFTFKQIRYDYMVDLTPEPKPVYKKGTASEGVYTVKAREGKEVSAEITSPGGKVTGFFTCSVGEPETADGWSTYQITVSYTGGGAMFQGDNLTVNCLDPDAGGAMIATFNTWMSISN